MRTVTPGEAISLALQHQRGGRLGEAEAICQALLQVEPKNAKALQCLGLVMHEAGYLTAAVRCMRQSIDLDPSIAQFHNNLAQTLFALGRIEEAIAAWRKAIELKGDYALAHSNLVLALHCHAGVGPEELFKEHQLWTAKYAEPLLATPVSHENTADPDRPLRIGYVSADFRQHSVAFFIESILRSHDRARFHVVCFSNAMALDDTTTRLRGYAHEWHDVSQMSDQQLADFVRERRIDILVDLAGHTAGNRLLMFARKPAPIQVTYLGYPDTTGLSVIDYRLTDAHADPPGLNDSLNVEKLVRLSPSVLCYSPAEDCPESGPAPSEANGYVTFGSFNRLAKVTPYVIAAWARILAHLPKARLLIKSKGLQEAETRLFVAEAFRNHGADPRRIGFVPPTRTWADHMESYNLIDIALDTFPYCGTTTTCEALWMGVPVISLVGKTHASRVGLSLLSNVGLPQFAASTVDEYVQMVRNLCGNKGMLLELRGSLRQRMRASPMTDAAGFTRRLEAAYRDIWVRWCRNR